MKKSIFTVLALFCISSVSAYVKHDVWDSHPSGNIKSEVVETDDAKMTKIRSEVVEIDGVKITKYYDESGTLLSQGKLKNGVEQGTWKYFDKDGNVIFTKYYVNGHIIAEGLGPKK